MRSPVQGITAILLTFTLFFATASAVTLEEMAEEGGDEIIGFKIKPPQIELISLVERREYKGVTVSMKGKYFKPPNGSITVAFPSTNGGTVSASSFHYHSDGLLIFSLPDNVTGGNVTVRTTAYGQSATSDPYYFEFHPPQIHFITGDEGIGPGKKIKVWGRYFDGLYLQEGKKTKFLDIRNGILKGADNKVVDRDYSVIELTLPEENFKKEFWVERNCDEKGNNCLKSNKIKFSNIIPPLITDIQADYHTRKLTIHGENFPVPDSDLQVSLSDLKVKFGDRTLNPKQYDAINGELVVDLPCPLPRRAEVSMSYKTLKSNSKMFVVKDAPTLLGIDIAPDRNAGKFKYTLSVNDRIEIPASSACAQDNRLYVGSTSYVLKDSLGSKVVEDLDENQIPASSTAYVVYRGIMSNIIDFNRQKFQRKPKIFRIESKHGFGPGSSFSIYGINLGSKYEACETGSTKISGLDIYEYQMIEELSGRDQYWREQFVQVCHRIPPDVTGNQIKGQFKNAEYGSKSENGQTNKKKSVSVKVGSSTSNTIALMYGDKSQKVAISAPSVRTVEYPQGHLPGDEVIIRGNEFGGQPVHNSISGSTAITPTKANRRGTELTFVIPAGMKTGDYKVYRKTPQPMESEPFEIVTSPFEKRRLEFEFQQHQDQRVNVTKQDAAVTLGELTAVNSYGELKISRFRITMDWKEGEPDNPISYASTGALPFQTFQLKLNGKAVSEPVTPEIAGNGKFYLDFPGFNYPLTQGDSDTFSIETTVLSFATNDSEIQLSLDTADATALQVRNLESGKGIVATKQESSRSQRNIIHNDGSLTTCIDTHPQNIHCLEYERGQSLNTKRQQERVQNNLAKKAEQEAVPSSGKSFREEIYDRLEAAKQKRVQEILEQKQELSATRVTAPNSAPSSHLEKVLKRLRFTLPEDQYEKVSRILTKKLGSDRTPILQETSDDARESKWQKMRQQIAEPLMKRLPIAERLTKNRLDSDSDGLPDVEEQLIGTDPYEPDTDGDGYSDFIEVEYAISPLLHFPTPVFSDIEGATLSDVSRLYFYGLLEGYSGDKFKPAEKVTRASFVSLLSQAFDGPDFTAAGESPYSDVTENDWYYPYIMTAYSRKIISEASGQKTFRPYDSVLKMEACEYILRYMGIDLPHQRDRERVFNDTANTAEDMMAAECHRRRLIEAADFEGGTFGKKNELTRGEMASLVVRAIRQYGR